MRLTSFGPLPEKKISALGFGCAPLLGRASRRESFLALRTAFDGGITLYDTARSYGYGASEGVLGRFLEGLGTARRDELVICTKFGILPVARNWKQMMKPVARAAIRVVPSLRQAAQRQAANQFNANQFSLTSLQSSIETSLRQLRTDYVDILLLHNPPASVLQQQDLFDALQRLIEQGKIRSAGISADLPVLEQAFAQWPAPLTTAQCELNFSDIAFTAQTRKQSDVFLTANHPFGGTEGVAAMRARAAQVAASKRISAVLREKLADDDPQIFPELVLNSILDDTGISAVIPAMVQPIHIHANLRAMEQCRFTAAELAEIRTALSAA